MELEINKSSGEASIRKKQATRIDIAGSICTPMLSEIWGIKNGFVAELEGVVVWVVVGHVEMNLMDKGGPLNPWASLLRMWTLQESTFIYWAGKLRANAAALYQKRLFVVIPPTWQGGIAFCRHLSSSSIMLARVTQRPQYLCAAYRLLVFSPWPVVYHLKRLDEFGVLICPWITRYSRSCPMPLATFSQAASTAEFELVRVPC